MNIGTYIKELRLQKEITQEELGKVVGVQRAAVQKWESGQTQNLKRTTIQKLAEYFDVHPASFISNYSEETRNKNKGIKIPVLGYVQAGIPIEAITDIIDYEEITEEMSKQGEFFGVMIKGNSMNPRIQEGDVVIVRKQQDVDSGDIAIVGVGTDEATCKQVKKHESGISLVSLNSAYEPMYFTNDEVLSKPISIMGKVVELRAKF